MTEGSGGQDLVQEVFDASYRRLVVQMLALCGDQAEAEDAVQEAFVKAVGHGRRFQALDNPEAWLRTVALNHLRNRWRRAGVLRRILPQVPGVSSPLELSPDRVALMTALASLARPLREVLVLHHLADLSVAEVAQALGIPTGTVKTRLVKARSLLAATLSDEEARHA